MPPLKKLIHRARSKFESWSVPLIENVGVGWVVVANGGHLNQIPVDSLRTACCFPIDEFCSPRRKSYCYVKFGSAKDAGDFVSRSHCTEVTAVNGRGESVKLIGFHVEQVPDSDKPEPCPRPRGLELHLDFVSPLEEAELVALAKENATDLAGRKVAHFGKHFDYDTNSASSSLTSPTPTIVKELSSRISKLTGEEYDQITANLYPPGSGIPPHVDNPASFGQSIASLSLLSPVAFDLKRDENMFTEDLTPRSLLIMRGDSRYSWTHSIQARHFDAGRERQERVSFTFRRSVDKDEAARLIERNLVRDVYNHIASDFSASRYKMWPGVEKFVDQVKEHHLLIDLGCGNGKNMKRRNSIGLEVSTGLADICRQRGLEVGLGDCTSTYFRDGIADFVISIAVLHHMASRERRVQALAEIGRLLKPHGRAMVTSWATDQSADGKESNYVRKEAIGDDDQATTLPIHKARTTFQSQDVLVPFKGKTDGTSDDGEAVHRFYHVFESGEMASLARESGFFSVIEEEYDDGNYVLLLTR